MAYLIISIVFLILFLDFLWIYKLIEKGAKKFDETKKIGTAKVVGYYSESQSKWRSLIVEVVELNDGKEYICNSGPIRTYEYPKGSVIDIEYANVRPFGIKGIRVNMLEHPPVDEHKMSRVFAIFSYVFLIITLIFLMLALFHILI